MFDLYKGIIDEKKTPKVMGMTEVAERLGWKSQQVFNYLKRAEAKGFPSGMFPKPFQRISSGWLWLAEDIEKYVAEREAKAAQKNSKGDVAKWIDTSD